jgi:hypothetical protein
VPYERFELDVGPAQVLYNRLVGAQSDEQVAEALEEYRRRLEVARKRRGKLVDILDIRHAEPPSPRQRRMQGEWNQANEALLRETLVGFTFIVSTVVMRGVITAVFWLKPLPVPHAVFTHRIEAIDWALDQLDQAGIPVSGAHREDAQRVFVER